MELGTVPLQVERPELSGLSSGWRDSCITTGAAPFGCKGADFGFDFP